MFIPFIFSLLFLIPIFSKASHTDDVFDFDVMSQEIREDMKKIHDAFDTTMNLFDEFFHDSNQKILHSFHSDSMSAFTDIVDKGESIEISVYVPFVENSENIQAYVNNGHLKIKVPQKNMVTKIILEQNRVILQVMQKYEEKKENKQGEHYYVSRSNYNDYKNLATAIDITDSKIEYKENDMLIITVKKLKTLPINKAQPRTIQITTK